MQICINTWALYNEGLHLGTWCDLEDYEDTLDELRELQEIHDLGDDIEPFLADWEDDDLGICDEGVNLEYLLEAYTKYNDLEDYEKEAMEYLMKYKGYDLEDALSNARDVICYGYDNFEDLAEEFVDEGLYGDIPDNVRYYLDYEKMGRDLEYDYDLYNGKIYRID